MAKPSLAFQVKRSCEPQLIVPSKPTPNELKNLSDIDDQDLLRCQAPLIWYYRNNPSMEKKDPVKVIREALGKALVYFYPLAGRLIEGYNRKLAVDCNGKGVLFIEADADISLHQLGDIIQPPCPFLDQVLYNVPGSSGILDSPLLLIQVTRLTCGGFILAIRFNHTISDAYGVNFLFMRTLGEMVKGAQQPSIPLVWQRELLSARNPPQISCTHLEYSQQAINGDNHQMMNLDQTNLVQCSIFFGPNNISAIRKHLPKHLHSCSRYELLTACLWRCLTLSSQLDPEEVVRLLITLSPRGLMHLPLGYYGNAFVFKTIVSMAGVLCKNPLGYAVELVKKARAEIDDVEEYIRSFADLMATRGRPLYKAVKGNFIITDNKNAGFGDVDIGWGCPEYGGPALTCYPSLAVQVKYNKNGEDGILVLICLPFLVMERFKQEIMKMPELHHDQAKSNAYKTEVFWKNFRSTHSKI